MYRLKNNLKVAVELFHNLLPDASKRQKYK